MKWKGSHSQRVVRYVHMAGQPRDSCRCVVQELLAILSGHSRGPLAILMAWVEWGSSLSDPVSALAGQRDVTAHELVVLLETHLLQVLHSAISSCLAEGQEVAGAEGHSDSNCLAQRGVTPRLES
jgi:hypothetical protein